MHKRVPLTTAISVVAGLTTATVGLTGAAAQADGTAPLPLAHYSHMLVDTAHRHIFCSQGAGSDGIVVTDLNGAPVTTITGEVTTITGEQGATGLVLSADGGTLYAALADGDAVAAVDTANLTESTRWATGAGSAPVSVAVAGGRVWYGHTAGGRGAIGSVDPSAADPVATGQPTYGGTTYRVYHHTVKPQVTATVTPAKPGQCQRFQDQEYYGGAWHTLTTSGCFTLDAHSTAVTKLTLTNATGHRFRVRTEYVHGRTDTANLSTWSSRLHLTVRT
ncbi:YncE family protein [Streptomyces sp. NPDC004009]